VFANLVMLRLVHTGSCPRRTALAAAVPRINAINAVVRPALRCCIRTRVSRAAAGRAPPEGNRQTVLVSFSRLRAVSVRRLRRSLADLGPGGC